MCKPLWQVGERGRRHSVDHLAQIQENECGPERGIRHAVYHFSANPRGRMRAISKLLPRELRHRDQPGRRDGFTPLETAPGLPSMGKLFANQGDVRNIVRCGGDNLRLRFGMGAMSYQMTGAIRAAHGHIESSGVSGNVLPVAGDFIAIAHDATLRASHSIARAGISKAGRLQVHFYESDLEGRPDPPLSDGALTSQLIIVAPAEKCERFGMLFYRAPNGAIVTPGLNGFPTGRMRTMSRKTP